MANVYTKKSRYPKTVTLRDFGGFYLTEFVKPRNPRCLSPTRAGNPHPSGLLYQDPYNRDNAVSVSNILTIAITDIMVY